MRVMLVNDDDLQTTMDIQLTYTYVTAVHSVLEYAATGHIVYTKVPHYLCHHRISKIGPQHEAYLLIPGMEYLVYIIFLKQ
jgi:hypothetical protein